MVVPSSAVRAKILGLQLEERVNPGSCNVTSATAHAQPGEVSTSARIREVFRDWRRRRPFWGGLLAILAGLPILYFPYARLSFGGLSFAMSTTGGAGSLIIGILLMVLGVSAWLQPTSRVFAGVATILLTLVSIPVSNLAGFGMGLVPGLIGGGLMAAWAPLEEAAVTAPKDAESSGDVDRPKAVPAEPVPAEAQSAEKLSAAPQLAETVPAEEMAAEDVHAGEVSAAEVSGEPASSAVQLPAQRSEPADGGAEHGGSGAAGEGR
jgi:hypothetical protein